MIYYKRKGFINKVKKHLSENKLKFNFPFFSIIKCFFAILLLCYVLYFFLVPNIFSDEKIEKIANNFLAKNSELTLDIDKLNIKANYKFDINISAQKLSLKYPNNQDFITTTNPSIDINLLTLFLKYIDIDKIKTDKISINTTFSNQKYECFNYFKPDILDLKKNNYTFEIRNINLFANEILINICDKQVNETYQIKTTKFLLSKKVNPINKLSTLEIKTKGKINSNNHKIANFKIKLLSKFQNCDKFFNILENINYNPFYQANKYKFFTNVEADLIYTPLEEKNQLNGQIKFNDLTFNALGTQIPKNNILLNIKQNKIYSNFDFNFLNNQFISIKSIFNLSKNKSIELTAKSSNINLSQLSKITKTLFEILNLNIKTDDVEIIGEMLVDLYLKSDFKTISSQGLLQIKNAQILNKKLKLSLDNINSNINLKNNTLNITNTSAYFGKSKFNISGLIDEKTNLNIKIISDTINLNQFISFIKTLPILSKYNKTISDIEIKTGLIKINTQLKGKLITPEIISNSYITNLNIYFKKLASQITMDEIILSPIIEKGIFKNIIININNLKAKQGVYQITAPKIKFFANSKEITIPLNIVNINNTKTEIKGKIKNNTQIPDAEFFVKTKLPPNNNLILIKAQNPNIAGNILVKNNNLVVKNFTLNDSNKEIFLLTGEITNYLDKNPQFKNLKIITKENIEIKLPSLYNTIINFSSDLTINGKANNPNINGTAKIHKIINSQLPLYIKDAYLSVVDNALYLNIYNGKLLNINFDITTQVKYLNKKITFDYLNFSSPYINLDEFDKNYNKINPKYLNYFQIKNMQGSIGTLNAYRTILDSINFEGNYNNSEIKINKFSANAFAGKVEGEASTNLITQKSKTDLILKEINIRNLTTEFKDFSIATSGKLSALISANFEGYEYNKMLKTLDCYIKFNINDGELSQFAKLERFLQAGNILSQSILKLSLNSTISALSKQSTGYFKTIEGTVKIKNYIANIQYTKVQGENMSLYLYGKLNLMTKFANISIFGKIPTSIANVLGPIGSFTTENIVNKMSDDSKEIIKSLSQSPFEKMLSIKIPKEETQKIPPLLNNNYNIQEREFFVKITGLINSASSVKSFKWGLKED